MNTMFIKYRSDFVPTSVREPATLIDILRDEVMYRAAQYDPKNEGLKWDELSAYTRAQYLRFADDYIQDGTAGIFDDVFGCIVFAPPEENMISASDYMDRIQVIAPDAEAIAKFHAFIKREHLKWMGEISDGCTRTPDQAELHEHSIRRSIADGREFVSALIAKAAQAWECKLIKAKFELARIFLDEDLGMREDIIFNEYAYSVLSEDDFDEIEAARRAAVFRDAA